MLRYKAGGTRLGFIVSKKWRNSVERQWKVNDRIAVIQIVPEIEDEKKYTDPVYKSRNLVKGIRLKLTMKNTRKTITIINCYAPHSDITKQNPKETKQLQQTINKLQNKSSIMIIAGDLNANVGKHNNNENNDQCIGPSSRDKANSNGKNLIELADGNKMILTNAMFCHKQAHLTKWS